MYIFTDVRKSEIHFVFMFSCFMRCGDYLVFAARTVNECRIILCDIAFCQYRHDRRAGCIALYRCGLMNIML